MHKKMELISLFKIPLNPAVTASFNIFTVIVSINSGNSTIPVFVLSINPIISLIIDACLSSSSLTCKSDTLESGMAANLTSRFDTSFDEPISEDSSSYMLVFLFPKLFENRFVSNTSHLLSLRFVEYSNISHLLSRRPCLYPFRGVSRKPQHCNTVDSNLAFILPLPS